MGWISDRHMKNGGSIGGRTGPHKGPLRKVVGVYRWAEGIFDRDSVKFECGHDGYRTMGAERGRCGKCGEEAKKNAQSPQPEKTE